jgi:hypothetical protein
MESGIQQLKTILIQQKHKSSFVVTLYSERRQMLHLLASGFSSVLLYTVCALFANYTLGSEADFVV